VSVIAAFNDGAIRRTLDAGIEKWAHRCQEGEDVTIKRSVFIARCHHGHGAIITPMPIGSRLHNVTLGANVARNGEARHIVCRIIDKTDEKQELCTT